MLECKASRKGHLASAANNPLPGRLGTKGVARFGRRAARSPFRLAVVTRTAAAQNREISQKEFTDPKLLALDDLVLTIARGSFPAFAYLSESRHPCALLDTGYRQNGVSNRFYCFLQATVRRKAHGPLIATVMVSNQGRLYCYQPQKLNKSSNAPSRLWRNRRRGNTRVELLPRLQQSWW